MPNTTHAYPFEDKVWDFAQNLSEQLAGDGNQTFLMILSPSGVVQTLYFQCPDSSWHALTESLDKEGVSYLFYDPFDAPEHAWLSWQRIDCPTMERLIKYQFEDVDFEKVPYGASRAPELQPPKHFPASWGVMF